MTARQIVSVTVPAPAIEAALTNQGGESSATVAVIRRSYPFSNDWRRGCWVSRPTGKPDRDYVYAAEFLRGRPDKASGMLRYSLQDLGGPGWIVYKDSRRVRGLVYCDELEYADYGEVVDARDILRVVTADELWQGRRCGGCGLGVVLGDEVRCVKCGHEVDERERIAAGARDELEVPF